MKLMQNEKLTVENFDENGTHRMTYDGSMVFWGWMTGAAKRSPRIKKEIESFLNYQATFSNGTIDTNREYFETR